MRIKLNKIFPALFILPLLLCACEVREIKSGPLSVELSDAIGHLDLKFNSGEGGSVSLSTEIAGAGVITVGRKKSFERGEMVFTRDFVNAAGDRCEVTDIFTAFPNYILWEVEIRGEGAPWTASIDTVVDYPKTQNSGIWSAWSVMLEKDAKWFDPLEIRPFENVWLTYGGGGSLNPNYMSIPMVSFFEKDKNAGFTIIQSLRDDILDMQLKTEENGRVSITRQNHRISKNGVVRMRMYIVPHGADWRAALGFCVEMFPEFFNPPNPEVENVAGCAAYSSWEGDIDKGKFDKMAFSFNWKATFDFPYMGLFLPEVSSPAERWERFHQEGKKVGDGFTSVDQMEGYMKRMRGMGYHVLGYFNLFEAGNHIKYPPPPRKAKDDKDLWRDANDFLYHTDARQALAKRPGAKDDAPLYSNWEGCVVVDPASPPYKKHLLEQAKRHIEYLPSLSGICIDRLDWLREYNASGDDGASWREGAPARSMVMSWKEAMRELGPLMHSNGKVIFANTLCSRIDAMEHVDGVYDEFGQIPRCLNRSAFLTLRKPYVAWTKTGSLGAEPDIYIQRHLYLGAYLTVPFPDNDHSITPDAEAEKYYMDYGSMLAALKGKRWVLTPDVLCVEKGIAKANVFENETSYIIPVIHGEDYASISLKGLDANFSACKVLYPGGDEAVIKPVAAGGGRVFFDIPLKRKCAMLVVGKKTD